MKDPMALGAPLAIVLFAAMAAAALRFGGQTAEAVMGARQRTAPMTVTVTAAHESRPQPTMTTGTHDSAGPEIFHELHAEGRNALCLVCDSQYRARMG